jgi:CxxH/CxxC protein (TIGR04129 family)
MAFDDFLVDNETFPHLEECSGKTCSYCSKEAMYELKLPENEDN